ncbi:hypothetical protein BGX27_001243, partial [Mortierella sp. AM989]
MVLSAIWTLAFGAQNLLPDFSHEDDSTSGENNENYEAHNLDQDDGDVAYTEKILKRQQDVAEAERDILGTTVYLPAPNIRDEAAENKSGFILVVTSLTLNNIGCYPFFGIRDRHQVFPRLFPETSPRSSFQYLRQVYRSQGVLGICIIGRLRQRSRKVLPKPMIYLSTRILLQLITSMILSGSFTAGAGSADGVSTSSSTPIGDSSSPRLASTGSQQGGQQQQQSSTGNGPITAVTATEISATIMAAMPTVSSSSPTSTTMAVNRARRGLRYLSAVTPRNPTLLQEFYPEMVCAMTSSMITRVLLYPLDTVASRVSAQGGSFPGIGLAPTRYSGFWDCWVRSIRPEGGGIVGLYSGVVDCIIIEAM